MKLGISNTIPNISNLPGQGGGGGYGAEAFVTEWTVGAGDTIKLPSYLGGGTMNYDVDWGDGSSDSNVITADKTHTYSSADVYQVVITGQFSALNMSRANATERSYLTNMVQWGTDNIWSSLYKMFNQCTAMQYTATDYPNLTALVENTQFREVFYNCDAVVNLDLSNWTNTANFTYLYYAFGAMTGLKLLNLTGWDTSNVTYCYNMCGVSGDTVDGCNFIMPDLDWTAVAQVENLFYDTKCSGMDISGWKFKASSTTTRLCRQVKMGSASTPFTIDASGWLQSDNIINMNQLFYDCHATSINMSGIDTSNVTDMDSMFYFNTELTHVTGLDVFDATSLIMTTSLGMFQYTKSYDWSTANANFGANWGPNLGNVTNMMGFFYQTGYTTPGSAPPNVSNWDTSSVTNMENMFRQAKWSGGSVDVSSWDVSSLTGTGLRYMFREAVGLTAGIDTSGWQIPAGLTNMSYFAHYSDLGGDIDFSHASCDLSGITTWISTFQGTGLTGFKLHGSSSFAAVTTMTNMFYVGTVLIPTADYDALLLRLAATATNTGVTLGANASNYTLGGAVEIARDTTLKAGRSWTINDAGGV
jgi:surface protein